MNIYCFECGYKNEYSGAKPHKCSACGASLEPKPKSKPHKMERHHSKYEEEEIFEEPEFDADAIKASIQLQPEEHDNKFMTVEQLRQSNVAVARGGDPVDKTVREEVMGTMLGTSAVKSVPFVPPTDQRSRPQKVQKLTR